MKRLLVLLLLCSVTQIASAQANDPAVIKDWVMLAESKTMIDVSYRVVKCGTTTQIHLLVFNENSMDQSVDFDVVVSGVAEDQTFTKNVKLSVQKASMYKAVCTADEATKVLKIDVPAGYDADKLILKVNFKS
jgi:hypothetical protein